MIKALEKRNLSADDVPKYRKNRSHDNEIKDPRIVPSKKSAQLPGKQLQKQNVHRTSRHLLPQKKTHQMSFNDLPGSVPATEIHSLKKSQKQNRRCSSLDNIQSIGGVGNICDTRKNFLIHRNSSGNSILNIQQEWMGCNDHVLRDKNEQIYSKHRTKENIDTATLNILKKTVRKLADLDKNGDTSPPNEKTRSSKTYQNNKISNGKNGKSAEKLLALVAGKRTTVEKTYFSNSSERVSIRKSAKLKRNLQLCTTGLNSENVEQMITDLEKRIANFNVQDSYKNEFLKIQKSTLEEILSGGDQESIRHTIFPHQIDRKSKQERNFYSLPVYNNYMTSNSPKMETRSVISATLPKHHHTAGAINNVGKNSSQPLTKVPVQYQNDNSFKSGRSIERDKLLASTAPSHLHANQRLISPSKKSSTSKISKDSMTTYSTNSTLSLGFGSNANTSAGSNISSVPKFK